MSFSNAIMSLFPAPPNPEQHTPATSRIPEPKGTAAMGLTLATKQVMIDDLQLEVTTRARRLRQLYNDQARSLRATLERRINRIPPRMRKQTMGELAEQHARALATKQNPPPASSNKLIRAPKRSSVDAFGSADGDKENVSTGITDGMFLANQKKRVKLTKGLSNARDIGSRAPSPAKLTVLSPRSHNSRTLPRSPFKTNSPEKAFSKPTAASTRAAKQPASRAPSRAVSRQGKPIARKPAAGKAGHDTESEGRDSEGSATSAVTTIVRKPATTTARSGAASQKATSKTTTSQPKKRTAATKKEAAVPATTRTLRKRN